MPSCVTDQETCWVEKHRYGGRVSCLLPGNKSRTLGKSFPSAPAPLHLKSSISSSECFMRAWLLLQYSPCYSKALPRGPSGTGLGINSCGKKHGLCATMSASSTKWNSRELLLTSQCALRKSFSFPSALEKNHCQIKYMKVSLNKQ